MKDGVNQPHAAGNGYGFPFDRSYLAYYIRLQKAMQQIEKFIAMFPYESPKTKILWELRNCMFEATSNKNLGKVVKHYQTKVEVLERLRHALRAAPVQCQLFFRDRKYKGRQSCASRKSPWPV